MPEPECRRRSPAVVRRCLQKRPEARFQSAADLAFAVATLAAGADAISPSAVPARARASLRRLPTAALVGSVATVALAAGTAIGVLATRLATPRISPAVARVQSLTDLIGLEESPAIAPDDKSVAFVAMTGGHRQIFVRLLTGGVSLQLTREPLEHLFPRRSPDSSSIRVPRRRARGRRRGRSVRCRRSAAFHGALPVRSEVVMSVSPKVGWRISTSLAAPSNS